MVPMRLLPVLALLLLPLGTAAQTPPAASPPPKSVGSAAAQLRPSTVPLMATDSSRREARALGELLQVSLRAQNTIVLMRAEAVREIMRRTGKPAAESSTIVDEVMMPDFRALQGKIEALLIENLAAGFSSGELQQLRIFFTSPVGQRWLRSLPVIEQDNKRQIDLLGQQAFRDSLQRHADELHARGVNF